MGFNSAFKGLRKPWSIFVARLRTFSIQDVRAVFRNSNPWISQYAWSFKMDC